MVFNLASTDTVSMATFGRRLREMGRSAYRLFPAPRYHLEGNLDTGLDTSDSVVVNGLAPSMAAVYQCWYFRYVYSM